jgi:hypothetical protein
MPPLSRTPDLLLCRQLVEENQECSDAFVDLEGLNVASSLLSDTHGYEIFPKSRTALCQLVNSVCDCSRDARRGLLGSYVVYTYFECLVMHLHSHTTLNSVLRLKPDVKHVYLKGAFSAQLKQMLLLLRQSLETPSTLPLFQSQLFRPYGLL